MRQGARTVAGLVAACALLAGCSGDGDGTATTLPPITGTPTGNATSGATPTTPAPETSTTDAAPTTSADLGDEHVPAAETTLLGFLTALNNTKDNGDFSTFDALFTATCTGCLDMRTEMQGWLAHGQTVEGGDWVVLQQSSSLRSEGTAASVFFLMYRTATIVRAVDGATVLDSPNSPIQLGSASLVSPAEWLVDSLGFGELTG